MTRRFSPLLLLPAVLAAVTAFAVHTTSASAAGFAQTRVGASELISAARTGVSTADFVDTQLGLARSYDETASGDLFAADTTVDLGAAANARAAQLQGALSEGSQGRVTMGVGYAQDGEGNIQTLIGTSEPGGYIRPGVRDLLNPDDIIAGGNGHAEQDIIDYAQSQGWNLLTVGAGRPICPMCATDISGAGAWPGSALRAG